MAEFERTVKFLPAWDKRNPNPKIDHGIGSVELIMALRGERGVVWFKLLTGWVLPHIENEWESKEINPSRPFPVDLGYHSFKPMYEGQPVFDCEWLPGGKCYYDGSTLNAQPVFNRLLAEGDEAVWQKLEDYYRVTFREAT